MFLGKLIEQNKLLVDIAVKFHHQSKIMPDTYVVDVDQFVENAKLMLEEANKKNIDLYYMLKQIGHNPYLAKELEKLGYKGAVVVDQKEAEIMMNNGLHICNAGHLVQPSRFFIDKLIKYGCDYLTMYSIEKIIETNEIAKKLGLVQKIILRVTSTDDITYSGQAAGFFIEELESLLNKTKELNNICIAGITSFPCFLYNDDTNKIEEQNNLKTVLKAKEILEGYGYNNLNINAPSVTCVETIKLMKKYPITSGEPGHGLTATTPYHAKNDSYEKLCILYLSEVSHNYQGNSCIFGGGYYRRSHIKNALVVNEKEDFCEVIPPKMDSIDYHLNLSKQFQVGCTVITAFRYQIFVTRSDVCLIGGIKTKNPHIIATYYSNGIIKNG